MRQYKKMTRTQRQLLSRNGYKGDLYNTYYVMEDKKYIYFRTTDGVEVLFEKESSRVIVK